MKKVFTCLILIYSLFLMACPKTAAVRKAAKASFEMAGIVKDVIAATGKVYDAGIINLATKDRLAAAEKRVASGGKHFNELLAGYIATDPSGVPADKLAILNQIFSNEIVTPFLEILQELKVISPGTATYLTIAIDSLRAAILLISGAFAEQGFGETQGRLAYV